MTSRSLMVAARATAAEALLRAAEIIEKRGWTKGVMADEDGAVCALGAISFACFGDPMYGGERTVRRSHLFATAKDCAANVARARLANSGWHSYDSSRNVTFYNDRVAKDKKSVVGMLRAAAKQCAAKEAQ